MHAYQASMSIRKLFAILIAIAMLFAPAFSRVGEASAAVTDHHAQMMESGHCQSMPADSDEHDKAAEKSCCISMCMGVAVTPPTSARGPAPAPAAVVPAITTLHLAYLGEIATPPPKLA